MTALTAVDRDIVASNMLNGVNLAAESDRAAICAIAKQFRTTTDDNPSAAVDHAVRLVFVHHPEVTMPARSLARRRLELTLVAHLRSKAKDEASL